MEIKKEHIIGYWIQRDMKTADILCTDCINEKELEKITSDDIISKYDTFGDVKILCNRCKKLIPNIR